MSGQGDGIETCLVCGEGVYSRGLCSRHHTQYHRRKKGMTEQQAEHFEEALIKLRMLAPPKPTGRTAKDDPFAAIADKIRRGDQLPMPEEEIDLAKEVQQAVGRAKAKQTVKQKPKQTAKQNPKQVLEPNSSKRGKRKRG